MDVADYLDSVGASPESLLESLHHTFRQLADFPELGRARPNFGVNYRSFVTRRYIVLYEALPDGVEIIRVVHGARNLDEILRSEPVE